MFRMQSILLLLKVITVSNALLMWPPTIYQLKRPSVNDNEIVAKVTYRTKIGFLPHKN